MLSGLMRCWRFHFFVFVALSYLQSSSSAFLNPTLYALARASNCERIAHTIVLAKSKNGGKPKQPKQEPANKDNAASPSPSEAAAAAAARVRTDIGIPVKTQIRILQAVKEAEKRSTRTVTRTSFRREKPADGGGGGGADDEDPEWTGSREPPLYLVDGYNVIGHWPRLRKCGPRSERFLKARWGDMRRFAGREGSASRRG